MSSRWYYVCDRCGSLVTIEDAPIADDSGWTCDDCGCNALWEFTNQENALQHSRHIKRLAQSGLLRRTT